MRQPAGTLLTATIAFAWVALATARGHAEDPPASRPRAVWAPTRLPLLSEPLWASSFLEAPPFDPDAQAFARLRASRDPVIQEIVRLMEERESRLAPLRARRVATSDAMAILALQREAEQIKLDFDRGVMIAQLDRARGLGRYGTASELERRIAALDHRRAVIKARLAAPVGR